MSGRQSKGKGEAPRANGNSAQRSTGSGVAPASEPLSQYIYTLPAIPAEPGQRVPLYIRYFTQDRLGEIINNPSEHLDADLTLARLIVQMNIPSSAPTTEIQDMAQAKMHAEEKLLTYATISEIDREDEVTHRYPFAVLKPEHGGDPSMTLKARQYLMKTHLNQYAQTLLADTILSQQDKLSFIKEILAFHRDAYMKNERLKNRKFLKFFVSRQETLGDDLANALTQLENTIQSNLQQQAGPSGSAPDVTSEDDVVVVTEELQVDPEQNPAP